MTGKFIFKQISFITLLLILFCHTSSCSSNGGGKSELNANDTAKYTNGLINETSPYLLQHAHNPVNWLPWSEEVFEIAKKENKLVLISVGYSSCHWCHVMEHESFEDEEVAAIMNENFICVKVDREERPDVDQVYMDAVQFMTNGNGGWPLNCFTLPDGRPIKGGTYFEKEQWIELLNNLTYNYKKSPRRFEQYADNVMHRIEQNELIEIADTDMNFEENVLDSLIQNWTPFFDTIFGGDLRTNKFPLPNNLDFLMQYAYHNNDTVVMNHVDLTLKHMALGGIFDQVGGGFSRYSTDPQWRVPHFEKMLYDNAQLISLYSKAYQRTKNETYKKVVYRTIEWAYREMMHSNGAFYAALDADTEGEEGKFYVWKEEELKKVLEEKEFQLVKNYYQINKQSLWEGKHILTRAESDQEFAMKNGYTNEELTKTISKINRKLLQDRNQRIKPGLDDKALTSWNALMQIGLLDAYQVFKEPLFLRAAEQNANWLFKQQIKEDGGLWHTFKDGQSTINGFLEDYCFTIEACIKLYEVSFDESYLSKADQLASYAIAHFYNEKHGMFYFSSDESELLTRKMEITDQVIPSSNSTMASVLFDLGILLDNRSYKEKAKQMLANVYKDIPHFLGNYSNWGILALNMTHPYYEVAITGKTWKNLQEDLNEFYIPNRLYMGADTTSNLAILEGKFLAQPTIFVCIEGACKMPTESAKDAIEQMQE